MKKLIVLFISTFVLFLPFLSFAAQSNNQQFLFVQEAGSAKLESTQNSNIYLLTLSELQPYVIYFSNRPKRSAGLLETKKFIRDWNKEFGHNFTPNAGLEGVELHCIKKGRDSTLVVTLSNPQYDAENNTVSYTVQKIRAGSLAINSLKHVALFIDGGYCPSCVNG